MRISDWSSDVCSSDLDGIARAVKVAQQVDGPVKVVYSREEDIQHDMYRPYYYDRFSAGLDAEGRPVAWPHRIPGSSVMRPEERRAGKERVRKCRSRWAPAPYKQRPENEHKKQ